MLATYLPLLVAYLSYLGSGIALLIFFSMLYAKVTPQDEIALIREGCTAAALSFGGALIGFSLTLASSAWHANKLEYFMLSVRLLQLPFMVDVPTPISVAFCLTKL